MTEKYSNPYSSEIVEWIATINESVEGKPGHMKLGKPRPQRNLSNPANTKSEQLPEIPEDSDNNGNVDL